MKKIQTAVIALLWVVVGNLPAMAEVYRDKNVPMAPVSSLDVNRYAGLWYEIARFPNRFERGCQSVTADYGLRSDGKISVTNTCFKDSPNGAKKTAEGVARVEGPGRLSVSFVSWLPFARGDYWVLYLSADYDLAVVGAPKGTTGWILARDSKISAQERSKAEAVLTKNGYDVSRLLTVEHN